MCLRTALGCICAIGLLVLMTGCGRRGGLVPVSGRVMLDGKPAEQASIVFHSQGGAGRPAVASTDKDGSFTMTTTRFGDGVMPGTYKVVVTKLKGPLPTGGMPPKSEPKPPAPIGDRGNLPVTPGKMSAMGRKLAAQKNELPDIYAHAHTTPFEVEVTDRGRKDLELNMSSTAGTTK